MNTQAYIEGFVKRAAEYGLNQYEALELLKNAGAWDTIKGYAQKGIEKLQNVNAAAGRALGDPLQKNVDNPAYNTNVKQKLLQ